MPYVASYKILQELQSIINLQNNSLATSLADFLKLKNPNYHFNFKGEFADLLKDFFKDKKDDYYCYSYDYAKDAKSIEITFLQLQRIMAHIDARRNPELYDILNPIFITAEVSHQKSVFLYGRNRVAK